MVGTARCAVPARSEAPGGTRARTRVLVSRFRRLTLRSATGTAQRANPYHGLCQDVPECVAGTLLGFTRRF
jgi:hypothetical protein